MNFNHIPKFVIVRAGIIKLRVHVNSWLGVFMSQGTKTQNSSKMFKTSIHLGVLKKNWASRISDDDDVAPDNKVILRFIMGRTVPEVRPWSKLLVTAMHPKSRNLAELCHEMPHKMPVKCQWNHHKSPINHYKSLQITIQYTSFPNRFRHFRPAPPPVQRPALQPQPLSAAAGRSGPAVKICAKWEISGWNHQNYSILLGSIYMYRDINLGIFYLV